MYETKECGRIRQAKGVCKAATRSTHGQRQSRGCEKSVRHARHLAHSRRSLCRAWLGVVHDFAEVNQSCMAHDVFISHAHKDKKIAGAICQKLESARVRCWLAERDISAGEDWTEATRNAIGSSRVMVLVLSENANAAPHIEREIAHAFYTRRMIIPLRLTNTLPRRDFLFYLGNVRWFDAFSPPVEQHLEELTASINSMVAGRTVTGDAMPAHGAIKTPTTLNFANSWIGALRVSRYRTLEILKRVAIAGSLIAVVWLLWFVPWRTKHEATPVEGHLHSMYSGPGAPPDLVPQSTGNASVSKPAYTYSRFGLWVAPNTGPTPSVQRGSQDTPSSTAVAQPASATPSPESAVDQMTAGEVESLQGSASARSVEEDPTRIINGQRGHRGKSRPKGHNRRVSASEGLRFSGLKSRLRALFRQIVGP